MVKSFTTKHTKYIIHQDLGDGSVILSGNKAYCPEPIKSTLLSTIEVGKRVVFSTENHPKPIRTTPVVDVDW